MSKFPAILAAVISGVVVILSLLTALASVSANLANGAVNIDSSTALLTSQCLTAFLVVVSLAAGVVLGLGVLPNKSITLPTAQPRWVSSLNACWQRLNTTAQHQLPAPPGLSL